MTMAHTAALTAQLSARVLDRYRHRRTSNVGVALFLGAGADISSGGLSFSAFKRRCLEVILNRHIFDITSNEEIDSEFQNLFSTISAPEDRAAIIDTLYHEMLRLQPSEAYKLLVLMANEGAIDAIITTNFDTLLELAESNLQRNILQVFAPGLARPFPTSSTPLSLFHRIPYVKLHGDLSTRSLLYLLDTELETTCYDPPTQALLENLLWRHDLIITGYSGHDPALAKIIGSTLKESQTKIYWCNPIPPDITSPLFHNLPKERLTIIRISFDDIVKAISKPVLEHPSAVTTDPLYIPSILEWRIDYCNREYIDEYAHRGNRTTLNLIVPRKRTENQIFQFLLSSKPLAVIVGPSGYGKTTIGLRLFLTYKGERTKKVLLIKAKSLGEADLEVYLRQQLGGLGPPAAVSIPMLEKWLAQEGIRLVIYLDGLNEYSTHFGDCVKLFRNIIRTGYFLPLSQSALRIIVTLRQETWNQLLSYVDISQLQQLLWSEGAIANTVSAIPVTEFNQEELDDALNRLQDFVGFSCKNTIFSTTTISRFRDPYILGIFAEHAEKFMTSVPMATLYQQLFEEKLKCNFAGLNPVSLADTLASAALSCLERNVDLFRPSDISPGTPSDNIVRAVKDLGIVVDAGQGFLRFAHDRIHEYFLALGLSLPDAPTLNTVEDLTHFLSAFGNHTKVVSAAKLYFSLHLPSSFAIVERALRCTSAPHTKPGISANERIFTFSKELLIDLTEGNPDFVTRFIEESLRSLDVRPLSQNFLQAMVQAASHLPVDISLQLLSMIQSDEDQVAKIEATIYSIDKIIRHFLSSEPCLVNLFEDEPYRKFFSHAGFSPIESLGRLLNTALHLGPDNSHPLEYRYFAESLILSIRKLLSVASLSDSVCKSVTDHILKSSDRLVFNATPEGLENFFKNPDRMRFMQLLERLQMGESLRKSDLALFRPYIEDLSFDLEYHFCHILIVLSAANDLTGTIDLWRTWAAELTELSSPVEVDFFQGALIYLSIIFCIDCNQESENLETRILSEWHETLLYRPGLVRGRRRGFTDEFDMIFEDGFGVIYPYGILRPGTYRRSLLYRDYITSIEDSVSDSLPLYSHYLNRFLSSGKIDEALQVLHAICQVVTTWPAEGFSVLRPVIGYPEPRIHRATVRILAESYSRHPSLTLRFLRDSGSALSEDDLLEITVRHDPRVGRRQVEEQHWARLVHLLFRFDGMKERFLSVLVDLLSAGSVEEAVSIVVSRLDC